MRNLHAPWSAPSAGVYGSDGRLVCTLGTADVVRAYRQRGDTNGAMIADFAKVLAAAPTMLRALDLIRELADEKTDCISETAKLKRILDFANLAIEAAGRE